MVRYHKLDEERCAFTITPNCALSWKNMQYLFLFFLLCSMGVSGYFLMLGAWMVLPFAGLEMLVLGLGVYASSLWASTREVVCVEGTDLVVLKGRRSMREVARMSRYWTQVSLGKDSRSWYPSRLWLVCHGRRVEIASFLVEQERSQLAEDLRERMRFNAEWHSAESRQLPDALSAAEQKV